MSNYSKLFYSILLLILVILLGTIGYWYFEEMKIFESFYMTLITISTVGFGEVKPLSIHGRLLTIFIIVSGIGLLTYTLGQIASIFIEGEIHKMLGRKKLEKKITKLHNHFIVCGYGRIGRTIVMELRKRKTPVVVIEKTPDVMEELEKLDIPYIAKDATLEDALLDAGLMRARGLVTAVSSDADNVFIALTARGLNSNIFILGRASECANENKLLRAGANRVVSPYVTGGKHMAVILERPTVIDFIDHTMMDNELGLHIEEITISPESRLAGLSLVEARLRQDFDIIVIGIKQAAGNMIFNPSANQPIHGDDCIICIGKSEDISRLQLVLQQ